MSDTLYSVIPTDPDWCPAPDREAAVVELIHRIAPNAERVSTECRDRVVFVDCGENFERVRCPACFVELDTTWLSSAMDHAFATDFRELAATMPCCAAETSLNNLLYEWPMGFARWSAEVRNPGRFEFDDAEVQSLTTALGHPVRVIYARI